MTKREALLGSESEPDGVSSAAYERPIRVLLMADERSPITWGWVDAVRSAGVTVLCADGKEWPECPAKRSNDQALGARLNRRLRSFSKVTPRRLTAIHQLRRLAGPSLAWLKGRRLRRLVKTMQPDLIHGLRIPYEGMMAAAACPANIPLAVSIWGNDLTFHASMNPLIARATRKVLERTDLLYADCQRDLDLARAWGLRPNASKSLLPGGGGIDLKEFCASVRPSRSSASRPRRSDDRIIVNTRGLGEWVRNDTFLSALSLLAPSIDSRTRIVFVRAAHSRALRNDIARHPLRDRITVTGQIAQVDMAHIFLQAEISISITDCDGTPNSLLEAMAAGVIPVCSDLPSIREWIEHGRNGFLADPGDPREVAEALRSALNLSVAKREKIIRENMQIVVARAERRATGGEAANRYLSLIRSYG
jgi:glycosyltransferase involved in cell wall biosynthesis